MNRESICRLSGVEKTYRNNKESIKIVKDCNLEVFDGEFVAITGPSGTGKSTLLKILSLQESIDDGHISLFGQPISLMDPNHQLSKIKELIGVVYQEPVYIEYLSLLENIKLSIELSSSIDRKSILEAALGALESVGLEHRQDLLASKLSGGEKQRMSIAMALVKGSRLILCDEPTGNLNRDGSDEIFELLKNVNERFNKTIIMVTHDEKLANKVTQYALVGLKLNRVN